MIDTLYVNGCSWTEGYLLEEEAHVLEYARSQGYEVLGTYSVKKNGEHVQDAHRIFYDQFNWAGNLARKLNISKMVNHAEGAGSNQRIVRTTTEYIKKLTAEEKEKTLVIIGWSLPDRNELFLDDKQGTAIWHKFNAAQEFSTLTPPDLFETKFYNRMCSFWQNYVVDVHSSYASISNFFLQSALLANFLENQGVKYFFFNCFNVMWGFDYNNDEHLEKLKQDAKFYEEHHVALPLDDTFSGFVGDNDSMRLSDGHPNSLAYQLWSDHLLENIQKIYG